MSVPPASPAHPPARVTAVLRVLVLSTFVVFLNETIMVNAIPRLMREFEVTAAAAGWLSTAFMLTMAVVIPVTGWFLQRVTTRTAFGLAMTLFLVGTALAAAAPAFPVLLVARVIQAGGTAVMMPLLMTTLMTLVPPQDRGRVMGNITLVISVAPALGPAVSGVLLQLGSWRLLFLAVLPIAVAMALFGRRTLVNIGEPQAGPIDWPSVPLAAAGFGALVYGLSELGAGDASRAPVSPAVTTVVGAVLVALFAWRQLALQRSSTPLLDLRTFTFRHFSVALALMCLSFMGLMGAFILLPIYLQEVCGLTSLQTGLLLIPGGLTMGLLGPQVGKLYDRFGAPRLVVPGAVLTAVCLALFALTGEGTSPWLVLALHVALSAGMAFVFTPVFTSGLSVLPPHLYPHGSAALGSLQQVSAAAGTALVISVMTGHAASAAADGADATGALATGVRWGFGVGAVLGALTVLVALLVRTPPVPEPPAGPQPQDEGGTTTDKTAGAR
ncbi:MULTISPECIES: DHA2 family efflux MFS transporter permease subunit [Streptomyces]|uniref:DHA2 family efflux MFS transporter permease subunit n=1 Tax=Streptomyces katrae TaxID=68223 RepID=A0ABT7GQJ1_9ACTN|nr:MULTISPECIES: DHA2 family efflux MFS transporter permease subunit [Streptomyces]MDK9495867.1 DHA2 family efflux MFS transporter permease subunit [Streptomyces katrae]GLX16521.1 MFS transporter [Streptomyces lavendulae subsp. lavendulae]GLX25141.1 MFS transporter [Streptomyces lavendulae subsp. lavendulae]